jgi:hypothetical protein
MKDIFAGYYQPTNDEFKNIWATCIFVFDANVFLNLYSYSPKATESFFDVLNKISDRIWVSHQAALEYQDNRLKKIATQEKTYEQISSILQQTQSDLEGLLRDGHLSINVDSLLGTIESTFASVRGELSKHKKRHPDLFRNDHIRNELTRLFQHRIGLSYSSDKLLEIYKVGELRYDNNLPPGYRDRKKDDVKRYGDQVIKSKYGDLIMWFQTLDKAIATQCPVLFITDDRKDDWWWEENGKTIGPRPELVTEMKEKASASFYMYTPTRFMENANTYLGTNINKEIIDEVRDVSEAKSGWKDRVIDALESLGGQANLNDIYQYVQDNTSGKLSKTWQTIIRRTLYNFSSDVDAYLGGDDLFQHLGKGRWGLRTAEQGDRAKPLPEC